MALTYRGDHTGQYDRTTQTGLLGKVIGPDADGAYRVITEATYDAERDVTHASTQLLLHPERALAAMREEAR